MGDVTTKRKPKSRPHYYCTQEVKITELHEAVNGNGKEGIKVTLARQEEHIKHVIKQLDTIDNKYDKTLSTITSVQNAFDQYKAECEGADNREAEIRALVKDKEEAEDRLNRQAIESEERILSHKRWRRGLIATTIVTLLSLAFLIYKDVRDTRRYRETLQSQKEYAIKK
jgi:Fe2+ transport system protein B